MDAALLEHALDAIDYDGDWAYAQRALSFGCYQYATAARALAELCAKGYGAPANAVLAQQLSDVSLLLPCCPDHAVDCKDMRHARYLAISLQNIDLLTRVFEAGDMRAGLYIVGGVKALSATDALTIAETMRLGGDVIGALYVKNFIYQRAGQPAKCDAVLHKLCAMGDWWARYVTAAQLRTEPGGWKRSFALLWAGFWDEAFAPREQLRVLCDMITRGDLVASSDILAVARLCLEYGYREHTFDVVVWAVAKVMHRTGTQHALAVLQSFSYTGDFRALTTSEREEVLSAACSFVADIDVRLALALHDLQADDAHRTTMVSSKYRCLLQAMGYAIGTTTS